MRLFAISILGALAAIAIACSEPKDNAATSMIPRTVIWGWERNEDLRFLDPTKHAVAFLSQTLNLRNDEVGFYPRRQPLRVPEGAYLIAVTRIEATRESAGKPTLSDEQKRAIIEYLLRSVQLTGVREVQIDFDAVESERDFYRGLIADTRAALDPAIPLTITALSSWCLGDTWLGELPIDDAVPMLFDIGNEKKEVADLLEKGGDWNEPLCRNSYGISLSEPPLAGLRTDRRLYIFKSAAWNARDLEQINNAHEN